MRTALLTLGIVAACLVAAWAVVDRRVELPPVGPSVEQICADTMQRTAADLSWVAQSREAKVRGREIETVTLGELPSHTRSLVRVAGVLHAEFEWVGLYPSRAAQLGSPSAIPNLVNSGVSGIEHLGAFVREASLDMAEMPGMRRHRELSMTQRYMHLGPAAINAAIRLLEPVGTATNRGDMLETAPEGSLSSTPERLVSQEGIGPFNG